MAFVKTGLTMAPDNQMRDLNIKNHLAMASLASGTGTRDDWDMVIGAINMAQVMAELGTGSEYRKMILSASDAMLQVGKRYVKWDKFEFCGDELQRVNDALEVHEAQLAVSRVIDIERATNEVRRRINNKINVSQVSA
jgi:hypothetical protein